MNVPDVDLVVVYGVPKNMSQLYQVNLRIAISLESKVSANILLVYVVVWKSWTRG